MKFLEMAFLVEMSTPGKAGKSFADMLPYLKWIIEKSLAILDATKIPVQRRRKLGFLTKIAVVCNWKTFHYSQKPMYNMRREIEWSIKEQKNHESPPQEYISGFPNRRFLIHTCICLYCFVYINKLDL